MKKTIIGFILFGIFISIAPVHAEILSADKILDRMINVVANRSLSQQMTIITKVGDQIGGKMMAGAARKQFSDGNRAIIVLLEPEKARGISYLFSSANNSLVDQWAYLPYIGRVRKIVGTSVFESFLETDFTFSDLSYLHCQGTHKILGEEKLDDTNVYKIEATPDKAMILYSKVVIWIAKENYLPIRQDFYDTKGRLWKRQLIEEITTIDGQATPLKIKMLNLLENISTELKMSAINTKIELLEDKMFMPEQLSHSLECPVWEKVCYRIDK
jgi:hypothetical protein